MRNIPDVEQRDAAESVVTPFVGGRYESSDQSHRNHDDAHEERGEDVGERKAGGEKELQQQQREADEPLDVMHELVGSLRWR